MNKSDWDGIKKIFNWISSTPYFCVSMAYTPNIYPKIFEVKISLGIQSSIDGKWWELNSYNRDKRKNFQTSDQFKIFMNNYILT